MKLSLGPILLCLTFFGAGVASMACSSSDATTAAATPGTLVFNEIAAIGSSEWLELANTGTSELDVGDYAVADTDKTANTPKVADAVRFPSGTKVAAGGYLLIALSKKDLPVGPYAKEACVPGAAIGCFYAGFGVSATSGESVHLLGPDNAVITSVAYPKALPVPTTGNKTACRNPDKTGDFVVCTGTPGTQNAL